jgi:PAS domain S-box-containing protein
LIHKLQITHEQLLEIIQEGIWVIDADSNTTFVNPKMAEILGYEPEEMIGKNLFVFMDEEEIQNAEKEVARRKEGISETHESKLIHKSGHHVYVEIKTIPITDSQGNYNGAVAGVADITERKKIEETLRARERFLATILETTIDGFWVVDSQKCITMVNDAYCAMSGYKREELLGMTIKDLDAIEKPEETAARIKRILKNGSELFQTCHRRKDGTIFPLEISITYLPENGGQMLCFCRDITERKEAEEALKRQASERAAVDAFTNSVSHDLQAPLRRIEGFSEALLEECQGELSDLARDYLRRITTQIGSMKERTDALLKLSRVVSHDIKNEEVNLSALARSYLEKLCYAEPDRLVETVVVPKMVTSGDVELINIVLENLLHNAWKFTVGVENARIECGSFLKDDRSVYFVKDNGVGFDQQRADEIFDPFKKLHGEDEYPGIGNGLNLTYRIITRHGGEIWAEGEPGKGACFYFTLP